MKDTVRVVVGLVVIAVAVAAARYPRRRTTREVPSMFEAEKQQRRYTRA